MIHILVIRDTKFWLVGPFNDEDDASNFGQAHYAPGGPDDPRWQTIDIPNTYSAIGAVVYKPVVAATLDDKDVLNNFRV